MKNKLYCYAAIFLIGTGALRGCVKSARKVPRLVERVKPSRTIEEPHTPWVYGVKLFEELDSANIKLTVPKRQLTAPGYSLSLDTIYIPMQLEEMKRQINPFRIERFQPSRHIVDENFSDTVNP